MPKKSAKQSDSDEDYAEAQSQPELDPGSLEAVLARVIGPLQAVRGFVPNVGGQASR